MITDNRISGNLFCNMSDARETANCKELSEPEQHTSQESASHGILLAMHISPRVSRKRIIFNSFF